MSFPSWLRHLRSSLAPGESHRGRRASHRALTRRLKLEILEDRIVPAFLAPVAYDAGSNPSAVVTADFNGDGHLDLATANSSSNDVSVLLGNGDGTFRTAQNYATSDVYGPDCIAAGDFNGDRNLDLVTGSLTDVGEISVLLGHGDGSFQPLGPQLTGGNTPQDVTVGALTPTAVSTWPCQAAVSPSGAARGFL
jgi:hypothetical protein